MQIVSIKVIKEFCGIEKGYKKKLPIKLAKQMEKEGYVEITSKEKVEKLEKKVPEKIETKQAPIKKVAGKTMLKGNSIK